MDLQEIAQRLFSLIQQFVSFLEQHLPSAPTWDRPIWLYIILSFSFAVVGEFIYRVLLEIDIGLRFLLRAVARSTSEERSIQLAAISIRIEAVLGAARLLTGVGGGVAVANTQQDDPDIFRRFLRFKHRVGPKLVGLVVSTADSIVRFCLRRTVPNYIIWSIVVLALGWLDPVIEGLATWEWSEVQASQVAAILTLIIVAWTIILRSDIRGRVEFSKVASLECRHQMLQLRPHLRALLVSESRVRQYVAHRLEAFPDESMLAGLTGYQGLDWKNRRLVVTERFKGSSLANPPESEDNFDHGWAGPRRSLDPVRDSKEVDTATAQHYKAVRDALAELRSKGYYYKLLDILPPTARLAVSELDIFSEWYCGLEVRAADRLSKLEKFWPTDFLLQQLWSEASTTKEIEYARAETERAVREAVGEARDYLWQGYRDSALIVALLNSISDYQRERLIDRVKT